jgi:GNAT superfamily N-acetyltransferase
MPPGLTLTKLAHDPVLAEDCRRFCLSAIKATYGYGYTPEWHADLDSLRNGDASHYAACNRGAFFVLRDAEGRVVGTAGVRGLRHNPGIATLFADRYPDIDRVAFNCRLYLDPAWRRQGLGRMLIGLRESAARGMGYATVYIHCDARAERLRRYWLREGFRLITDAGGVAHYDKPLRADQPPPPARNVG